VSYNTNQKSDFIQPTSSITHTEGNGQGIAEITNLPNPGGTSRNQGTSNGLTTEDQETEQTTRPTFNCKTPRGETVKDGQFVKAYKHKNGFNDAPCEVQLRTCVIGKLEGTFTQLSCRNWDTSYIDRLDGIPERNDYPTTGSASPTPHGPAYSTAKAQLIRQIRASERNYQPEYGNSLNSSILEQILSILDS